MPFRYLIRPRLQAYMSQATLTMSHTQSHTRMRELLCSWPDPLGAVIQGESCQCLAQGHFDLPNKEPGMEPSVSQPPLVDVLKRDKEATLSRSTQSLH